MLVTTLKSPRERDVLLEADGASRKGRDEDEKKMKKVIYHIFMVLVKMRTDSTLTANYGNRRGERQQLCGSLFKNLSLLDTERFSPEVLLSMYLYDDFRDLFASDRICHVVRLNMKFSLETI